MLQYLEYMVIFSANTLRWFVAIESEPFFTLILLMIANALPGHGGQYNYRR